MQRKSVADDQLNFLGNGLDSCNSNKIKHTLEMKKSAEIPFLFAAVAMVGAFLGLDLPFFTMRNGTFPILGDLSDGVLSVWDNPMLFFFGGTTLVILISMIFLERDISKTVGGYRGLIVNLLVLLASSAFWFYLKLNLQKTVEPIMYPYNHGIAPQIHYSFLPFALLLAALFFSLYAFRLVKKDLKIIKS